MTTTPSSEPDTITISTDCAKRLAEVLEHCDRFLRTASPTVQAELAAYCRPHYRLDPYWLIDMAGLHALHLQTRIAETGTVAP